MIIMHIVAYLATIIVNILVYVIYFKSGLRAYEITIMCYFSAYSVCTVIFGLILN